MNNKKKDIPNLEELFFKYYSGRLSPEEAETLDEWAGQSVQNARILEVIDGSSPFGTGLRRIQEYDKERVRGEIMRAKARKQKARRRKSLIRYTAAVAIVLAVASVSFKLFISGGSGMEGKNNVLITEYMPVMARPVLTLSDGTEVEISASESIVHEADNTILAIDNKDIKLLSSSEDREAPIVYTILNIPVGADIYVVNLEDGTRVWLNSGSSLTFPTRFDGENREVNLSGEAYFEVAHDKNKRFLVHCDGHTITVLGTSFNISAYDNDPDIRTTLLSGSVMVNAGSGHIRLMPEQQSIYTRSDNALKVREVHAYFCTAWKDGYFVFIDEPVDKICMQFSRWYGLEFDVKDDVASKRFSGMLQRYDTFNNIAKLINSTEEIVFREKDGKIEVSVK